MQFDNAFCSKADVSWCFWLNFFWFSVNSIRLSLWRYLFFMFSYFYPNLRDEKIISRNKSVDFFNGLIFSEDRRWVHTPYMYNYKHYFDTSFCSTGCLSWAASTNCHGSVHWPPAYYRSQLRKYSGHRILQHWLAIALCGHRDSLQY